MELRNADYTLGGNASKSGSDEPFMIHASLITIYGKGRDTILEGVTFSQGRRMDGSCLKASVSSDNKKATLSGDVLIRIDNDGTKVTIRTQGIEWNGDDNTFLCTQEVDVTYGDGTVIRAEGFSASMDDNRYDQYFFHGYLLVIKIGNQNSDFCNRVQYML